MTDTAPPITTRIIRLRLGDLELLDAGRNARYMRHETMVQLAANIKADGGLTSVPFASLQASGRYRVLSGNHRVMAALDALGPDHEVDVMVTDEILTDQRALALQLSHNAIAGEDDPAILKALYDEIDNVDWRAYSGLDDQTLAMLNDVDPVGLSEANLTFQNITFVFLPEEASEVRAAFDEAKKLVAQGEKWLVAFEDYDAALDAITVVGGAAGVKNQALAFRLLIRLAETNYEQLVTSWWDAEAGTPSTRRGTDWVPLAAILGIGEIPPDAAGVIRQAMEKAVSKGDVTSTAPWQLLELLAAEYLAGA